MKVIVLLLVSLSAVLANPASTRIDPLGSWRVVGGADAAAGQFPFIISLRTASNSHTCGGSLIRNDWVITAAHCVVSSAASSYTVVAGINQLNSNSGVRSAISRIIVHSGYNANTIVNDIALLQLTTPIQESSLIRLIQLETENVDTNRDVTLIGWGRTSYPGNIPNNLQFLNSRAITYSSCRSSWIFQTITTSQICTFTQSGQGACHGDSGGPLISVVNGIPVLTGLVSWGAPCAVGMPDVYTRVSSYISWINQNIGS